ncbi:SKP1-like protein 1B [Zingiber officinale]|uniref:SKP1 component dimerisation domain-containing protein n=1 Tax=Zingiber officinale TaxID=94328 RepID=A0A8J5GKE2_ZINOF|nr:SKP1-like protein 1B [Zingiber officinale]KAG6505319.1 hypothetical protein ZIOFF_037674 [Zingiber officinale]
MFWCIQAANYMDIKELLNLSCQSVADMIIEKTPGEIRKMFNIKNDFTPEEEEKVANYINIKGLLDLLCQSVADMITGNTPEEIRKTFNIKNDFTFKEKEKVRRENQWAFQ